MEINVSGVQMRLLSDKAIYWPEEHTLLVSDLHIGKIAHFRKEGIALPANAISQNFIKLDALINKCNPIHLIFLGDLFHSDINNEWNLFCTWRKKYPDIEMNIVPGNHDVIPACHFTDLGIMVYDEEMIYGPFCFRHTPLKMPLKDLYIIAGHVHPVVRLYGRGGQSFRLPCFYFNRYQAILPSFGYFTGGYPVEPDEDDLVIAIANEELIDVSAMACR